MDIIECDTCGKRADGGNHYKEGWIRLDGELSKGAGKYDDKKGRYISQWINARDKTHHFCSWDCLKKHDDNKPKEA